MEVGQRLVNIKEIFKGIIMAEAHLDPSELASHLGTLGNETRLLILSTLATGGAMSSKEIAEICPGSINQHIRKLVDTGFLKRSRRAPKEGERQTDVYDVDSKKYKAVIKHMQTVLDIPKVSTSV